MAVVICFLLPFYIAYNPPWGSSTWWHSLEAIIEVFFCLDVLIHFNTTVFDSDGNEVFSRNHIAMDYLSELHFWIDMAATVPTGVSVLPLTAALDRPLPNSKGDQNHKSF